MGKRKAKTQELEKRKKIKQAQDAQLSTGLFNGDIDEETYVNGHDWENEEQDYELRPRKMKEKHLIEASLPIKREDGRIERVMREVEEKEEEEEEEEEEQARQEEQQKQQEQQEQGQQEEDEDAHLSPREKLIKTKEEIAELGSKLIENPEENIACLTRLRKMSESKNFMTSQLAIMALLPIFKSLAPSYRIRSLTDAEKREKVSRDVARLRQYEQTLVVNYKAYLDLLSTCSKISYSNSANNDKITTDQLKRGNLALKAATELCTSSLRHFNYRKELFTILIKRLNRKPAFEQDVPVFIKSVRALETLLKDDEEHGDITVDIITILTKTIRDKKYRVDESVVNILLSASLLADYSPNDDEDKPKIKMKKKDRVHLSKKERKNRKERKEIEEEIRQAQQAITVEQREKYQAQVLKMILMCYLEILKASQDDETQEGQNALPLIGSALRGLCKIAHLINVDLVADVFLTVRGIMMDIIEEFNTKMLGDCIHALLNTGNRRQQTVSEPTEISQLLQSMKLHTPEIATLRLIYEFISRYGDKREDESWEDVLLDSHYCPMVKELKKQR
ncbi:intranuclear transport and DNA replication mediator [Candida orthopsilosis Co 90-125]|uniref:Intranuclear transport and DNA replication mediator n=1 Tax=Candida orthopsilosis (strain 90-125) TaxID=1136231 RepID=H8XAB2_CANO9|nr:intranuclear transport and DNA replication mediator [Candida orthopsilosis Co 90-125]CCG25089.1 intranuclear transport and DNA replication mediator [Candida orthopsilosis Co 90-125]